MSINEHQKAKGEHFNVSMSIGIKGTGEGGGQFGNEKICQFGGLVDSP